MIDVIGIGLEGKSGLTEQVLKIIDRATILSGGKRHLSYFAEHPGLKIPLTNLQQDLDLVIAKANEDNSARVVIFATGDPLFFGLGRLLLLKVPHQELNFYPHLSSVQLAFSKLKLPWQDADLLSLHGRDSQPLIKSLKQGQSKIAILTDRDNNPQAIASLYLDLKLPLVYSFHLCENLSLEEATITSFTADKIKELATLDPTQFANLNVLILLREEPEKIALNLDSLPLIGIPDSAFLSFSDRPGLMTKKEVRSLAIAELEIQAKQTIWDIGAGTGSVSIEIARLSPSSQIYAIEKTAIGITLITQNSQRFTVNNIKPIAEKAPASLPELPSPDRIFIGGSGGNLSSILDSCQAKIKPQGIIVLALATLENLSEARQWAQENNWQDSLLQVQLSRSVAIANLTRFNPLNPVTIIKLQKT